MRLFELTMPPDFISAHEILTNAGYKKLGFGKWGAVYRKGETPYVLKVFAASDKAYLAYLALINNHSNIHFPKTFGKLVKVTPKHYAIRLEPLKELSKSEKVAEFIGATNSYIKGMGLEQIIDGVEMIAADNYHWLKVLAARDFMEKNPNIKQACDLIATLVPPFKLDIEIDNILLRGDTFVFTDPVWDTSEA